MRPRHDRPGFTLVELMIVTVILGILAGFAIPAYHGMILKAKAARVVGDFQVVKLAAYSYFADHNAWPPDVNRGVVPPGLVPYLPDNFSFLRDTYKIDWENWSTPDGTPTNPGTGVIVGISVVTTDTELGNAVMDLLGNTNIHYTLGDHYTIVISPT
ncbi:MAG TPA: prepilin-type N-terminal cleavage/methylation domain-containing protein [Longimicrobiales bacterium]|nr:prepilin-type N-terminal cleavage/methylation domain-containing protein [Longimicrobiales bacterium]